MAALYAFATLACLAAMAVGFLSFLVYPFKFLGIKTRSGGFGLFVLATIGAGVCLYQFAATNGSTATTSVRSGVAEVAAVTQPLKEPTPQIALPLPEQQMIDAVNKAKADYDGAANDMAKGATRPARARALCSLMPGGHADNWIGTVSKLSSNSDGKGVLEISVADGIAIKTWNNDFSDFADHTLLDPNSPVFAQASKLQIGQTVRFSGRFARSGTDCLKEASMTISGSMTSPDFIFHFDQIAAQ